MIVAVNRKVYSFEVLHKSLDFIFIYVMNLNSRSPFVLGAAYFTEQYEIKNDSKIKVPFTTTISHFELKLADITNEHPDIPFIILGNFNSKIGLLNQIDEECIPVDATAFGQRFAVDDRKDSKGEKLLEVMERNGQIALNGRFPRDSDLLNIHTLNLETAKYRRSIAVVMVALICLIHPFSPMSPLSLTAQINMLI